MLTARVQNEDKVQGLELVQMIISQSRLVLWN